MLLVAGVAVLVAVAAADVVRRGLDDQTAPPPATTTQRVSESFPQHVFPGRLLYADELCEVTGIDLANGAELPFRTGDIQSCSGLWAPFTGEYMVIGLEDGEGDGNVPLMLRKGDTGESDSDTPLAAARPDTVVTGQWGHIGWCDRQERGGVLRPFGNGVERVRGCPVGFLLNGRVVVQRGQELFVGDRRVRTLTPGTLVVGVSEHRLAVFDGGTLTVFPAPSNPDPSITVDLPDIHGRPLLAPDGCAVLYPALRLGERATVRVRNLGCGLAIDREFDARGSGWRDGEATWSPDGTWIAISGPDDSVRLYRSDGGGDPVRLPAPAEYLAWTG